MDMPVDERGHWIAPGILNTEALCSFPCTGELFETADLFEPSMTVSAATIDLMGWEKSLSDAQQVGIEFSAEFLARRLPRLVPSGDMLSDVKARRERQEQYASKRPDRVVSQ